MILKDAILPFISRKIRALEAIVTKKRGLTNAFKVISLVYSIE